MKATYPAREQHVNRILVGSGESNSKQFNMILPL